MPSGDQRNGEAMRRIDPNDIAITRDRQRLELVDIIASMDESGNLAMGVYADRLRAALTNGGEYIEEDDQS